MENLNFEELKCELIEDIEVIWADIARMHPELIDGTSGEHCVEIRSIIRKPNKKDVCDKPGRSFHLWKADEKSKKRFVEWYEKHIFNKGACLFISVHNFDSTIEALRENGKKYKKYSINSFNQKSCRVLVADLDNVSSQENNMFDDDMKKLKIPFESIQTSENGYQKRIYLKEIVNDEYAVAKFTKLLFCKGYKVDIKLINRGQVVRLKGTTNNKCFSNNFPNRSQQFEVTSVIQTDEKISIRDLWRKINLLPTLKYDYKIEEIDDYLIEDVNEDKVIKSNEYDENYFKEMYSRVIKPDYLKSLQKPIKRMLIDAKEGYTDGVILFLIPYFKNTLNLSFEEVYKIFEVWGRINNYTELDKIERIYYTEYKKGFGAYSQELAKKYGSIDFRKDYDTVIKINDNTINVKPNIFEKDIYIELDKTALKVFMAFLFEYKAIGKITWSLSEVIKYNNISKPTAIKCLKNLTENQCIACTENFKTKDKGNEYTLMKTYIAVKTERRVEFTLSEIRDMIKTLKGNEIKLYIYIKYMVLKSVESIYYGNQKDIGERIGMSQQTVSDILKSLNKKRFINIEKITVNNISESNSYTLLV